MNLSISRASINFYPCFFFRFLLYDSCRAFYSVSKLLSEMVRNQHSAQTTCLIITITWLEIFINSHFSRFGKVVRITFRRNFSYMSFAMSLSRVLFELSRFFQDEFLDKKEFSGGCQEIIKTKGGRKEAMRAFNKLLRVENHFFYYNFFAICKLDKSYFSISSFLFLRQISSSIWLLVLFSVRRVSVLIKKSWQRAQHAFDCCVSCKFPVVKLVDLFSPNGSQLRSLPCCFRQIFKGYFIAPTIARPRQW